MNPTRHNGTELLWAYHRKRQTAPDCRLRDQVLKEHDKLAIAIARRAATQCGEELEDLIQYARIGLQKAVERYNPEQGAAFSSFAVPYIRGEILHFLRDKWNGLKIPRRMVETHSKVKRLQRQLQKAGRNMDETVIARKIGIPESKWRVISEGMSRKPMLSLSDEITENLVADATPIEDDHNGQVYKLLGKLEQPYRACITEYVLAQIPIAEIANRHKMTPIEVQSAIDEGLFYLKGHLEAENS